MSVTLRTWWDSQRNEIEGRWNKHTWGDLKLNAIYFGEFVEAIVKILSKVSPYLDKSMPCFNMHEPAEWYTVYLNNKFGSKNYSSERMEAFDQWRKATKSPDYSLRKIYSNRNTRAHLNPLTHSIHTQEMLQRHFLEKCNLLIELIYQDDRLIEHIDQEIPKMMEFTQEVGLVYMGIGLMNTIEELIHEELKETQTAENQTIYEKWNKILEDFSRSYSDKIKQQYRYVDSWSKESDLIDILRCIDKECGGRKKEVLDYYRFLEQNFDTMTTILKTMDITNSDICKKWTEKRDRLIRVQNIDNEQIVYLTVIHLQMTQRQPIITDVSFKSGLVTQPLRPISYPEVKTWLTEIYPYNKRKNFSITRQCTLLFDYLMQTGSFNERFIGPQAILLLELPEFTDVMSALPWNEKFPRNVTPLIIKYNFLTITSIVNPTWFEDNHLSTSAKNTPVYLDSSKDYCLLFPCKTENEINERFDPKAKVYWTQRNTPSMENIIQYYNVDQEITVFSCVLSKEQLDRLISSKSALELLSSLGEHNKDNPKNYISTTISFKEWQTVYHQTSTMRTQ